MFALGTVIRLISQCPSTNLTPLLLFSSRASPLSTELGQSKSAKAPAAVGTPAPAGFLKEVCEQLNLTPAVVISPSLSGMYSLPFLLEHQALVRAYIPVAPICTDKFTAEQYQSVKVESLCVRICLCLIFLCRFLSCKSFFSLFWYSICTVISFFKG